MSQKFSIKKLLP